MVLKERLPGLDASEPGVLKQKWEQSLKRRGKGDYRDRGGFCVYGHDSF